MNPILLEQWHFTATYSAKTPILPDGCRDLIVKTDAQGNPQWMVSQLSDSTHWEHCAAGQGFMGFRLHPAVRIAENELLMAFQQYDGHENAALLLARLEEYVRFDADLAEVLELLATASNKMDVIRTVGVSERTVERLVKNATGRRPLFWRNLARARRTARNLSSQQPLAELAADNNYADQAHMTREFKKWFGVTPGQLMQDTELTTVVQAIGYE